MACELDDGVVEDALGNQIVEFVTIARTGGKTERVCKALQGIRPIWSKPSGPRHVADGDVDPGYRAQRAVKSPFAM